MGESSGDCGGSDKVKSVTDATEDTNVKTVGARKGRNLFGKHTLESKMNPRFLAEEVGRMGCVEERESDRLMILQVCCGSPVRRNSVLEGLRVK